MMFKLKKSSCCPIAALMRETQCLGTACAWHSPETGACLIYSMSEALVLLGNSQKEIVAAFQALQDTDEKLHVALDNFEKLQGALKSHLQEADVDA